MSTSKSVIRTGSLLLTRLLTKQTLTPIQHQRLLVAPHLTNLNVPSHQHDVAAFTRVANAGILYPCGLPSLNFYLPEGDGSSDEMIMFPKRTFQPSTIRRKRTHGFFARKATKGGRKVIARRIAKGRQRVTA